MDSKSLSYKTLKNITYSFFGVSIPILFSVFITPVIIHRLGVAEYGILILTNTITGFLGLLNLGLAAATIKYISEYQATNEAAKLRRTLNTAHMLNWIVGLSGFFIFFLLGRYFLGIFNIQESSENHILTVFILAGLAFFLSSANSVYTSIPPATQRFDIVNKINLSQLAFYNLGALVLVLIGFQLKAIMVLNLFTVCIATWVYRFSVKKLFGQLNLKFQCDKKEFIKLYSFGLFSSMADISNTALNNLDRLIIPIFLSPTQLSYYSLPGNVAQKTTTVVGSLGGTLFPMANALTAQQEVGRLSIIFRRIIRNLSVIAAAITVSIMLFGKKILLYWLGVDFSQNGGKIILILAITYFILSMYGIVYHFLMGLNKIKFVAWWSFGMGILNLILILILIKPFGILGVAWAFLIGVLPIFYLFYWIEKKCFYAQNLFPFYFKLLGKIILTGVLFWVIIRFSLFLFVKNLTSLIFFGPLSVLFYILLYRIMGFFEKEDLKVFWDFYFKILTRFGIKKDSSSL